MNPPSGGTGAFRILFVCTANQCRSPLAGALLAEALAARGVAAEIETEGLAGAGLPATEATVTVAAQRHIDLTGHRSRQLAPTVIESADLILGMERLHVREVVVALPSAWPHAFTLKEFVRRGATVGARRPEEPLGAWIARVHAGRERRDLLGASVLDDLADPTGGSLAEHEDTARELEDLVDQVAQLSTPADRRNLPSD